MVDKKTTKECKELYQKHYGIDLSNEEAAARAEQIVRFYKGIYDLTTQDTEQS